MKISYNWLKAYLSIDKPAEELAEILTNTGLEVEGIESFCSIEGGLEGLVVGEVISKEKHPDADRLSLTTVNVGGDSPLAIVCGAPNVAAGQKVIVAMVGAKLYPNDGDAFEIRKSKIRGAVSEGMICAEDEIGLGQSHDGIMVLPESTKVGTGAAELFEVTNDIVFEIGLTPNRSDAMSHIGVAKDIAAALNAANDSVGKVMVPKLQDASNKDKLPIEVIIENEEACPRYSGAVINEIKVAPSPKWIQDRLKAIGIRPINNVVDITNFVLKEFGQPLHAFDYNAIAGNKVIVKTLPKGTSFVTLDGEKRTLTDQDLMICNEEKPMCMAGVFGGLDSGVTDGTTSIFLESAYFNSTFIRKTSTVHGLRTDAAQRYEKGADPTITIDALQRAINLLEKYAGASLASDIIDVYPTPINKAKVSLSLNRLNLLTGVDIAEDVTISILKDLDIEVEKRVEEKQGILLHLAIPPYRADVLREADVIEEVLRIYGYNNIPIPKAVKSTLSFRQGIDNYAVRESAATRLSGMGYSEITTNSISKSKFYAEQERASLVKLQNSMTAELDVMRRSLLPDGLVVVAHNINRKQTDLQFFEFGNIYFEDYSQQEVLALYQTGNVTEGNWIKKNEPSSYYELKSAVYALLDSLGIQTNLTSKATVNPQFEYGIDVFLNDKEIASIGAVHSDLLDQFDIEQSVFSAQLNWTALIKKLRKKKIKFSAIPKFPQVDRDVAIIVKEEVTFDEIERIIQKAGGRLLQEVKLFDVFRDEAKIGKHLKSCALSFSLLNPEKTLTDKEIDKIFNKIMRTLETELSAVIRK